VGAVATFRDINERLEQERRIHFLAFNDALPRAIADEALSLVYQPQVDIATGALHAVEVPVRWQHPEFGRLPPDFVPVLVRRGVIARLDGWVLSEVARRSRDWTARGHPFGRLAVKLATLEPGDGEGRTDPAELVRRNGGDPRHVEFELTVALLTHALSCANRHATAGDHGRAADAGRVSCSSVAARWPKVIPLLPRWTSTSWWPSISRHQMRACRNPGRMRPTPAKGLLRMGRARIY
jgi:hypothetical protein